MTLENLVACFRVQVVNQFLCHLKLIYKKEAVVCYRN